MTKWMWILFFSISCHAQGVLFLSDIHFDPLADRTLVSKLVEQPVEEWNQIFASSKTKTLSAYRTDTNYALWQSALEGMKKNAGNPSLVVVAGDFFRHTFRSGFEKAFKEIKGDPSRFKETYAQFQQKTIQFLVQGLVKQFPQAQFIPVIGNNESTCGDYMVYLNDPLLKEFAKAWQAASKKSIPDNMSADFASSGHFTTTLSENKQLRIIVSNNIFLTPAYNGRCGNSMVPPGQGELAWLDQQLTAAATANEQVWLLAHVPPGVDVMRSLYKTLVKSETPQVLLMIKDSYSQRYLDLLQKHAKTIQFHFAGHNHFADFRIPGGEVPMIMIPSISPDKTNNPAFQVLDFDAQNLKIKNLTQYSLDLTAENPSWSKLLDFNQSFQQSGVSLSSLKAVVSELKEKKYVDAYIKYSTSNGELAKALARVAFHTYVCAMTEMTAPTFETCAKPKE